jgi:hypothetical protein
VFKERMAYIEIIVRVCMFVDLEKRKQTIMKNQKRRFGETYTYIRFLVLYS